MKRYFALGTVILLCSSCASIFNSSTNKLTLVTTAPATFVVNGDTPDEKRTEKKFTLERQKKDLHIAVIEDSISKNITIKPANSFAYWSNIFNYGLGMLVDKKNPKRYAYPKLVYINTKDTIHDYATYDQRSRKGQFYLHLSLPYINTFLLKPDGEPVKSNTGFLGAAAGIDYYHSAKQFISLTASGVLDFILPFPAPYDFSGEYERMLSTYAALSNNHRMGRFTAGYGISYTKNTWSYDYNNWGDPLSPPPPRDPVQKSNNALGFVFTLYYFTGEHFFIGTVYRPTLFRHSAVNPLDYEHLISVDFGWKINFKKVWPEWQQKK